MSSNYFSDKNVLVVGATGYIGGQLYRALEPKCKSIIGWGRPRVWEPTNLNDIDILYYIGSQTDARWAEDNINQDLLINTLPFLTLVHASPQAKIIYAAAATQVGYTSLGGANDEFRFNDPISVYDIHKHLIEMYLKYFLLLGRECISLRMTNVYGPGKYTTSTGRNILNSMIWTAINDGQIAVYGEKKRDFLYIDDAVRAFMEIAPFTPAQHYLDVARGVYLCGSGRSHTFIEAARGVKRWVEDKVKSEVELNIVEPSSDDPFINQRHFRADYRKLTAAIGWRPQVFLDEGIKRTIEWMTA
jgi:nucleoside-diphosphate-sugar epimerase